MSIPKKGSRAIEVDGVSYWWRIRRRPTTQQADGRSPLMLAVAAKEGNGPVLVVRLNRCHPKNRVARRSRAVTPRDVVAGIREGRRAGWEPHKPGRTIEIEMSIHHKDFAGTRIYPPGRTPPTAGQIADLARERVRLDTLKLTAEEPLTWAGGSELRSCGLCINGRDLLEHVRDAEYPHIELELAERRGSADDGETRTNFAGEYAGLGLHQYRLPSRRLFGPAPDAVYGFAVAPDDPQWSKSMLLGCTCGINECWFLLVTITVLDDFVVWTDFEQFHRYWVLDLGPFVFAKQAYLEALAPV